jgi:hypothetical protein
MILKPTDLLLNYYYCVSLSLHLWRSQPMEIRTPSYGGHHSHDQADKMEKGRSVQLCD